MTNSDKDFIDEVMRIAESDEGKRMAQEAFERYKNNPDKRVLDLKEQDIMKVLKVSYIAERFFGKSRSWLTHKLNHDIVNGKRSELSESEREKLKDALDTIALELQSLTDSM